MLDELTYLLLYKSKCPVEKWSGRSIELAVSQSEAVANECCFMYIHL